MFILLVGTGATLLANAQPVPRSLTRDDMYLVWGGESGVRGQMSVLYQTLHTEGLILVNGVNNQGAITDTHSVALAVDYRLSDRWELHASLPFVSKRSRRDSGSHDPLKLDRPHPESQFLDDGDYHGTWQDWVLGLSYSTDWGAFHLQPYAELVIPSHDYTFFANAAPGQQLNRFRLGIDVFHRVGRSNFYYSAGYTFELVEQVMGVHINKHHTRLSAGYYFTPQLSARAFAQARFSQGRDSDEVPDRTSESWYQHDRLARHEYAIAGLGATWRINDRWALTGSGATMVWGRTVHELKYAYDLQLARAF